MTASSAEDGVEANKRRYMCDWRSNDRFWLNIICDHANLFHNLALAIHPYFNGAQEQWPNTPNPQFHHYTLHANGPLDNNAHRQAYNVQSNHHSGNILHRL